MTIAKGTTTTRSSTPRDALVTASPTKEVHASCRNTV
jgi:hypothetical protein